MNLCTDRYLKILVLLALSLLCIQSVLQAEQDCKKLRRTKVLGIKSSKEYLVRGSDFRVFRNAKQASKAGYTAYSICNNKDNSVQANQTSKCKFVFGIKADNTYIAAKAVKRLKSIRQATKRGFVNYSSCQSSATPTPTPAPAGPSFTLESGVRHDNIANSSTVQLPDLSFVAYLGLSSSSIEQKSIARSTSADGLIWTTPVVISGITQGAAETFTRPALYFSGSNNFLMVYEAIRHVSSAGVDFSNLEIAEAINGTSFTEKISGNFLQQTQIESPALIKSDSELRLYYTQFGDIKLATSTDLGVNWTISESEIQIYGIGSSLAPYPTDVDVIKTNDNQYRMYFASPVNDQTNKYSIFSAISGDGLEFTIEENVVLGPQTEKESYLSPDAVVLSDNRVRLYFVRITPLDSGGYTQEILSAISD